MRIKQLAIYCLILFFMLDKGGIVPILPDYARRLGAPDAVTGYHLAFCFFALAACCMLAPVSTRIAGNTGGGNLPVQARRLRCSLSWVGAIAAFSATGVAIEAVGLANTLAFGLALGVLATTLTAALLWRKPAAVPTPDVS